MRLYHPHYGVRELAELNSRQRRLVWRAAVQPASLWLAPLSVVWLLLVVFVVAPFGQRISGHFSGALLLAGLAMGILAYMQDRLLTRWFRGRVQQFIREHEADLRAAA